MSEKKKYLVIMMHTPFPREGAPFYEQLHAAIPGEVVARLSIDEDNLEAKMREASNGQDGLFPLLVFREISYGEDLLFNPSELVFAAAYSTLATGNPAQTVEYDFTVKGRGRGEVIYSFSV